MFGGKFGFKGPFKMEKNISCWVSVSDLNQNSGFGRTLFLSQVHIAHKKV